MVEKENIPKDSALFYQIVLSFHSAAWQQMGKVVNPITNKVEKDLQAASLSIDILDMLKSKTKGNLTREEEDFLNRTISELKLNYIDELKSQTAEESKSTGQEPEESNETDDAKKENGED